MSMVNGLHASAQQDPVYPDDQTGSQSTAYSNLVTGENFVPGPQAPPNEKRDLEINTTQAPTNKKLRTDNNAPLPSNPLGSSAIPKSRSGSFVPGIPTPQYLLPGPGDPRLRGGRPIQHGYNDRQRQFQRQQIRPTYRPRFPGEVWTRAPYYKRGRGGKNW